MSKTLKTIIGIVVVLIILGGVWYGVSRKSKERGQEKETIKIGVILPLTGTAASQGESERKAIELAVEQKNNQGGINGKKIKLTFEDDTTANTPAKGTAIAKKLLFVDGVKFIIGPSLSTEIEAIAPLVNKEKAIMIAFGGITSPVSRFSKNVFASSPTFASETYKMVDFIKEQDYEKVAFLGINTEAGLEVEHILEEELAKHKNKLVISELVNLGVNDFKTNLLKIKEKKPDVIYVFHIPALFGIINKQIEELEIETAVLGFHNTEDPSAKTTGGNSLDGVVYTAPIENESRKRFFEDFVKKYGSRPNIFSDSAYDAANLIFKAVENKGLEIKEIRNYLENIENYHGASGIISFDENRNVERDYIIKTVKNGQFVPYEE